MSVAEALDGSMYGRVERRHQPPERPVQAAPERGISAELSEWWDVIRALGLGPDDCVRLERSAQLGGSTIAEEIAASSKVDERSFYRAFAADIGIAVCDRVDPKLMRLTPEEALALLKDAARAYPIQYVAKDGRVAYVMSPEPRELSALRHLVRSNPELKRYLVLVPRRVMRAALIAIAQPLLISLGRDRLFLETPEFSARVVANAWQGAAVSAIAIGIPVGLMIAPTLVLVAFHVVASMFFFACIALRLMAACSRPRPWRPKTTPSIASTPTYSVLVALRDEAAIVPELLVSLGKLVWPRSRLEVKLICEADDSATIDAIRARGLRSWVEVIVVPPGMPRTKPNALSYALPLCRGEFVVLYDAEDRPHPRQLIDAWRRFSESDQTLACLQAPIDIDHRAPGVLPRMFGFEYAGLFRRLLPLLGRWRVFVPLGGTSNHFRRSALDEVGAWDPYNVTEDADLGVRLARFGYRTDVLATPTREDAPDTYGVWLRQRTRWLKGWMQTWLVHMRRPGRLLADVGIGSFVMIQIMLAGMVVSMLAHPLMLLGGAWFAAGHIVAGEFWFGRSMLAMLDAGNIVLGYAAFVLLGLAGLPKPWRAGVFKVVLFTPLYWAMMSIAAWRAVYQLYAEPHRWEKTPHKPHRRPFATSTKSPVLPR